MKHKKLRICTVFLGLGLLGIQAQNVLPASAGDASGTTGTVSYSIGQLACSSHSGTGCLYIEGVQQPYLFFSTSGTKKVEGMALNVAVFPNPTPDRLVLEIPEKNQGLSYSLCDMYGKTLFTGKVDGRLTEISMDGLVTANYILKIAQGKEELKSLKIIKY